MSPHGIRHHLLQLSHNARALADVVAPEASTHNGLPLTPEQFANAAKIREQLRADFDAVIASAGEDRWL